MLPSRNGHRGTVTVSGNALRYTQYPHFRRYTCRTQIPGASHSMNEIHGRIYMNPARAAVGLGGPCPRAAVSLHGQPVPASGRGRWAADMYHCRGVGRRPSLRTYPINRQPMAVQGHRVLAGGGSGGGGGGGGGGWSEWAAADRTWHRRRRAAREKRPSEGGVASRRSRDALIRLQ